MDPERNRRAQQCGRLADDEDGWPTSQAERDARWRAELREVEARLSRQILSLEDRIAQYQKLFLGFIWKVAIVLMVVTSFGQVAFLILWDKL
jgi:hypothetical protein